MFISGQDSLGAPLQQPLMLTTLQLWTRSSFLRVSSSTHFMTRLVQMSSTMAGSASQLATSYLTPSMITGGNTTEGETSSPGGATRLWRQGWILWRHFQNGYFSISLQNIHPWRGGVSPAHGVSGVAVSEHDTTGQTREWEVNETECGFGNIKIIDRHCLQKHTWRKHCG